MRQTRPQPALHPTAVFWMAVGLAGFVLLPWYMLDDGLFSFSWMFDGYPFDSDSAPALFLVLQGQKLWLAPLGILLILPFALWRRPKNDPVFGNILIAAGLAGLAWFFAQGYGIGLRGWNAAILTDLFGKLPDRQFGMGWGAVFVGSAFLFLLTLGIAARGAVGGDIFVVSSIGLIIGLVTLFIFLPILKMLASALVTEDGAYSISIAVRALTVLPIITPPFVIGLALILAFRPVGAVTTGSSPDLCWASSRRAGSTACPECSSRRRSPSPRSPSSC
jgi:iron(III) transport system permease protein